MEKQRKLHAIMIAIPYQGHMNPFVYLALKFASRGITVTFVHLEAAHRRSPPPRQGPPPRRLRRLRSIRRATCSRPRHPLHHHHRWPRSHRLRQGSQL
ncbi:hypothetical protein OROMI_025166 [Orobanche minor]